MEYAEKVKEYPFGITAAEIAEAVALARELARGNERTDVWRACYGCIDLTSLNGTDSAPRIDAFAQKAAGSRRAFPGVPDVASVCVYPSFIETVGLALGDSDIAITSVAGGFPSSQTYLEVKALETAMAVENGADEIDIVLNLGQFLTGDYDGAGNEIEILRGEAGSEIVLKVIIESGALADPSLIWRASVLAMLAGADFIKTSTGKVPVSATPEAAVVMCTAIKEFYARTGRRVGFKAAGGVATAADAALYYTIVESILGAEWLTPALFRIGASSLANHLLTAIEGREIAYY